MASTSLTSRRQPSAVSETFGLSWDNEFEFHLSQHVVHLRRFYGLSQAAVAKASGTSQSKIARIEGGDGNVTIGTIKKLLKALNARLRFGMEPATLHLPYPPPWWHFASIGKPVQSGCAYDLTYVETDDDGQTKRVGLGFVAASSKTMHIEQVQDIPMITTGSHGF